SPPAVTSASSHPSVPEIGTRSPFSASTHRLRILAAVARQAGSDEDNPPLHRVDRKTRNRWVDALKGLRVPISGTLGWDEAEVTAGGLALGEVDPATMAVRRHPGLYVFGELLDLTGPIGGLNFQLAFATAELAARAAQ
ncbi:MAG: NAD(P)/FAD-dependent oxidoreductase, partial [Myxococcota bacterium]